MFVLLYSFARCCFLVQLAIALLACFGCIVHAVKLDLGLFHKHSSTSTQSGHVFSDIVFPGRLSIVHEEIMRDIRRFDIYRFHPFSGDTLIKAMALMMHLHNAKCARVNHTRNTFRNHLPGQSVQCLLKNESL